MGFTDGKTGAYQRLALRLAKPKFAFDYTNQAWLRWGVYLRCGHGSLCGVCYGTVHEGEPPDSNTDIQFGLDMYLEGR